MNYIKINKVDIANGIGIRVSLWVAGCNHHCLNCHNPETWNEKAGQPFTEETKGKLFKLLSKDYIDGLTLSGGDPLFPNNREPLTELCKEVKEKFPNKTIWCWTGYLYEQVKDLPIMEYIDVLVDGPYIDSQRDITLNWRGSPNQRVIDVQKTRKENEIVLFCK